MPESPSEQHLRFKAITARSSGFTLVELLIVVVIIGLLSAIAIPAYNSYVDKAKLTVSINTLESVRKAIDDYYSVSSSYPPNIDMTTGGDGSGRLVLDGIMLAEFKKNLTLESYASPVSGSYTFTVRANNRQQTLLVLVPGQVITPGP